MENRPGAAEPALPKRRATLEDQGAVIEVAELGQQPQQVVLRDIEQRGSVGVGPAGAVHADSCARQTDLRHVTPSRVVVEAGR